MVSFIKGLTLFLGLFEFVAAYKYLTQGAEDFEFQALYLGDTNATYLYVMFILCLGLQRLTFALGEGGFGPWLCLVVTHAFESVFWWKLALHNDVMGGRPVQDFLVDVLSFSKAKHAHYFILLLLVPSFVLMFLLCGWTSKRVGGGEKRD
jgi:hypothetical protein